jgi:TetR/AcrR family transcriptional regulator, cholesterol catabolism regulator
VAEGASPRPRQPRRRMLDAAIELTSEGGYDALQVRAVAERAGVSSRTIYEYFQSLDALLIVAVAEQSEDLNRRFMQSYPPGRTAAIRVNKVISELTETMTANKALTVGLIRALVSGKPDVAQYVNGFRAVLQAILANAIASGRSRKRDREIAEILESIWFTALVGWATGADSDVYIGEIMRRSTRLLLPNT